MSSTRRASAGTHLIDTVVTDHPSIRKAGYRYHLVEHAARLGVDMDIVQRSPAARGFTPLRRRWRVERTYGWLMFHRRLARDYETLPARSEAVIHLAMTDLMARRLIGETRHHGIKHKFQDETPGENDLLERVSVGEAAVPAEPGDGALDSPAVAAEP